MPPSIATLDNGPYDNPITPTGRHHDQAFVVIRAADTTKDGGHLILLGLTPDNLQLLRDGMPIYVDCTTLGKPGLTITIMFGQTERSIIATLRAEGIELPGLEPPS
jgi:hypothetical protein